MTRRLLLGNLSIAVLVLLCLEIPLAFVYSRAEKERTVTATHDEADSVSAFAELSLAAGREERELAHRLVECARRIGGQVVVVGRSGAVIASSHRMSAGQTGRLPALPEVAAALSGLGPFHARTSTIDGTPHLSVAVPVGHDTPPAAAVHITVPTDAVHSRVNQVWLLLALAGLAVLAAVTGVAFAFARWAARPIRELEHATAGLADGRLDSPVPVTTGPPEVRSLAETFNRTAARLEQLLASQRAFAGEASHQLKTPLAALRLRLDNLEPAVAVQARGSLNAALTETDRLANLVEGLLAMARLEDNAAVGEAIDAAAVCAERHRTWAALFKEHDVDLVFQDGGVDTVLALPGAVEQILDNLLANALRASPPGSTVRLELRHHAPGRRRSTAGDRGLRAELHVIDEGPGMPPEQRRRAFDRFWRAPGAPKGGTGLGLSLVQRLAQLSGGEAVLREGSLGGLDAFVRLPCPGPASGRPSAGHRPQRPASRV
ncbi:sensor histidine kinase [Streptomyces bluensis]|uniref:sensor histidine kinase n=1 Tax=Streptomyces bluensis TaxID=33897 RepID=UPI001672893D|nr:HAMP domain-containing sensor histidine kinase [Streptomyces bluensis]GGZ89511.1 hypothetical protein GCM10010344_66350 [Streptomyces bluensis]